MGTFTKADITVEFKNGVPASFKNAAVLKEDLMGWFLDVNPNHKGRVDIFISEHNYEVTDDIVDLEVSSDNYNNCEFQAELVKDFLVANHPKEVESFSCSAYTAADELGSTFSDEDEWNDYVNEE